MGYIYKITNIITGKCYIGETIQQDPTKRFRSHLTTFRRGAGCPALRDAVKKYGEDKFRFEVLIICFDCDRFKHEKEYIKKYNSLVPNGYNIKDCGEGTSGFRHTDEVKNRISKKIKDYRSDNPTIVEKHRESVKKFWSKEENKVAQSNRLKTSEKHKTSVQNRLKNHIVSHEIKQKISKSLKEYNKGDRSILSKQKISASMCKPVVQCDLSGNPIKKFNSINEASDILKLSKGSISKMLCGRSKTCGGFTWKFDKIT